MPKLLLISFDAVGSDELSVLSQLPNFKNLMAHGTVFNEMKTVFVSNTYPVHCSIATGVVPQKHGLCSNTLLDPAKATYWNYDSRLLKHKTLWQAAEQKGLTVGNVLWPVTGSAASIRWNIPEIAVPKGQSQLKANLKNGTVGTQLKEFWRHRKLLNGVQQPQLDNFAQHCAIDIITEKNPDLFLLHLTGYDSMCHKYGRMSDNSIEALKFLDKILGNLIEACKKANIKNKLPADTTQFVIFSDHAQLNVQANIHLNKILEQKGFLDLQPVETTTFGNEASNITDWRCFFQYSGGSAFFFNAPNSDFDEHSRTGLVSRELEALKAELLQLDGVDRLLTENELHESGFADCAFCGGAQFGLSAKEGWYFDEVNWEKATHGYTTDRSHYATFCAINRTQPVVKIDCKTVTDITKLVASLLDLEME
jgi:predicted AlkP superfamily pyrophosphatase or phosphodiesterase